MYVTMHAVLISNIFSMLLYVPWRSENASQKVSNEEILKMEGTINDKRE